MLRAPALAAVSTIFCLAIERQWPWRHTGVTDPREEPLAQARDLLVVGRRAARRDILQAHRRLLAIVHPDKGGSVERVREADRARDLLLSHLDHRKEVL